MGQPSDAWHPDKNDEAAVTHPVPLTRHLPILLLAILASACGRPPAAPPAYQGYVEADLIDVGPASAGRLSTVDVRRGDRIDVGAALFRLDDTAEQAQVDQARARVAGAEARVDNLLGARRTPEIHALRAQVASAESAVRLSQLQLDQAERLFASTFVSRARLDEARAAQARDRARLAEAEAHLANATIAIGRSDEVKAAQSDIGAARAGLVQAQWQLAQRAVRAPAAALVYDVHYSASEWVQAGAPVVSLLPPGHVKLRFFVPEADVGRLRTGAEVEASCNGCAGPIRARIDYVSPKPEYTPPVIYSRESRSKLVFLVEARPEAALGVELHPGQPVDVRLGAVAPGR